MEVREWYAKELQGLSLRNVSAAVYDGKKKLYEDFGEDAFYPLRSQRTTDAKCQQRDRKEAF